MHEWICEYAIAKQKSCRFNQYKLKQMIEGVDAFSRGIFLTPKISGLFW
jgi:hypothetical protein